MNQHKHPNMFIFKDRLYTKNAVPGTTVYGEHTKKEKGVEYREWDVFRSKLASAITKRTKVPTIKPDSEILYLGASTGTTVSHLSDMLTSGHIYAVEFAPTVMRGMVFVSEKRKNIAPILADANHPETYPEGIPKVDIVFQDIAQRNQVEIFIKNCNLYLKKGGIGLLAIKARSIDVTKNPKSIFTQIKQELSQQGTVLDMKELGPFQKDHAFYVLKR